MYADQRSRVGWLAYGLQKEDGVWVTSEGLFKDKAHAIANLNYCFSVPENTIYTLKVTLPKQK